MKLMFCEECGDIVAPSRTAFKVRFCDCGRHGVWWEDPVAGKLCLYDMVDEKVSHTPPSVYNGFPKHGPKAYVLGIHNGFLTADRINPSIVQLMLLTSKGYIFEKQGSLIARFRPIETNDTRWAEKLP